MSSLHRIVGAQLSAKPTQATGNRMKSETMQEDTTEGLYSGSRVALLVVGTARSGTSALTRTLSLLGADLPRNLAPADKYNPAGYWESADLVSLHDQLLAAYDMSSWNSRLPTPAATFAAEALAPSCAELVNLLRRDFANSTLFVAKDPRMCRLLPLWHRALPKVGFEAKHVLPVRHPMEVAASLSTSAWRTRTMPEATGMATWVRHVVEAERASRGRPRVFVSYNALLEDWQQVANRIATALQIDWPVAPEAVQAEVDSFLTGELRHHRVSDHLALDRYPLSNALYKAVLASLDDEQAAISQFEAVRQELLVSDDNHRGGDRSKHSWTNRLFDLWRR